MPGKGKRTPARRPSLAQAIRDQLDKAKEAPPPKVGLIHRPSLLGGLIGYTGGWVLGIGCGVLLLVLLLVGITVSFKMC